MICSVVAWTLFSSCYVVHNLSQFDVSYLVQRLSLLSDTYDKTDRGTTDNITALHQWSKYDMSNLVKWQRNHAPISNIKMGFTSRGPSFIVCDHFLLLHHVNCVGVYARIRNISTCQATILSVHILKL